MDDCETVDDPAHAWTGWVRLWQGIFWAFVAGVLAWLIVWSSAPPARQLTGVLAVVVLGLAFALLRPAPGFEATWRNHAYLALAVVAVGVAVYADGTSFALLFIVNAQVWIFSSGPRRGIGVVLALGVSAGLGFVAGQGWTWDAALAVAPTMVISLLFSILLGVWVNRIIDQSLERAALIEELSAARASLDAAQHAAGVLAERERMAREIHDTLAQGYTSVIMLAQGALAAPPTAPDRLTQIEAVARENLAEARALVAALSPVGLSDSTLVDAIRRLTSRFAAETGVSTSLDLPPSLAGLPREREVVLLRAVQEALANVRRHAGASGVTVRVSAESPGGAGGAPASSATSPVNEVSVVVTDDGVGIGGSPEGFGLSGMRSRVTEAGGSMDVFSTPGNGTTVRVRVPGVVA